MVGISIRLNTKKSFVSKSIEVMNIKVCYTTLIADRTNQQFKDIPVTKIKEAHIPSAEIFRPSKPEVRYTEPASREPVPRERDLLQEEQKTEKKIALRFNYMQMSVRRRT